MTLLLSRVARTTWILRHAQPARARVIVTANKHESFSTTRNLSRAKAENEKKLRDDPRIKILGRAIEDDFATIRENYGTVPFPFPLHGEWPSQLID
jgi:hypothetical protein